MWEELERRLARVAPLVLASLCEGASPDELERVEGLLGQPLPDEVRAAWSVHDGQDDEWPLLDGAMLLPLDRALALRAALLAEPALDWPGDWLPVASDGRGDLLVVDLAVGALEQYGRLREKGSPPRDERLRSLRGTFELLCEDLDRERKVWDDLYGLIDRSELAELRKASDTRARLLAQLRRRTTRGMRDAIKKVDGIERKMEGYSMGSGYRCDRGMARAALGLPGASEDLEAYLEDATTRLTFTGLDGRTTERVKPPPMGPALRALIALLRRAPALAAMPAPRGKA